MSRTARALAALTSAVAVVSALLLAPAALAAPAADPPSIAQLCAATGDDLLDALLDGVADADLVGTLAPLLTLTVPQDQGRVLKADVDVDDVRTALGCVTTPSTSVTPGPATSTPSPVRDERDCNDFATRQDAQDFYDSVTTPANPDPSKLDQDSDGVACETSEGPASSGTGTGTGIDPTADDDSTPRTSGSQVVDIPEGSASTGA